MTETPLRILHVVGRMTRGGVETWLMHMLRRMDRGRFRMDFLVSSPEEADYDSEIRALGGRPLVCGDRHLPWRFAKRFREILETRGPYDIVHSHVQHFNGLALWLAARAGVRGRIAHSHNTSDGRPNGWARGLYRAAMERWISASATDLLACSRDAAAALFGENWPADPRCRVLYYGIDSAPLAAQVDRAEARAEFGIPAGAMVVGHVGRFAEQKNHARLVEMASALAGARSPVWFLLVGDGPLRENVRRKVREQGLENRFVFAGVRSDVGRLMVGVMDVFVFPSLHEGLPLAGLEAQAAGLPCLISDRVSRETSITPATTRFLPLESSPREWARAALALGEGPRIPREEALRALKAAGFDCRDTVGSLGSLYEHIAASRD
ncbi:MAG: glycosyltransferase family 1 protein [Acidobacteria bacterium]|nr:glycosyltransferase family 1 protein [Acidobacteriota bacterium]